MVFFYPGIESGERMKAKGQRLSEKQIGYLMVIPALIIILVIAIWPVARSFWISLYDVRLNDPTKSQINSSYSIDMEKYTNTYPLLSNIVKKEAGEAAPSLQAAYDKLQEEVANLKKLVSADGKLAQRYEEIDKLLFDFKPVPADLKYVEVDKSEAENFKKALSDIQNQIDQMKQANDFQKADDVKGLFNGVQSSVIEPNFIGLTYYKQYLTDSRLWASLGNTLMFTVISVFLELVLGLWIAMLINRQFVGRGLIRASVLIPWAVPTVISALMWKFMYDGQNGIIAYLFSKVGLIPDMGWLLTTKFGAMTSIILSDVWKTTPFMALLLFAGLQTIPDSLYEAAEVDGASKRQQFFRITLPLLKGTVLVALLFRTLDAFRVFDLVYVLTGGGPANSTETISIYAYKTMFAQMNFGAGSALSVLVFLCIAIISIGYIKILGADLLGERK